MKQSTDMSHTAGGHHVALRCLTKHGQQDVTYAELARLTNRFANALRSLGVGPGDRVFSLVGRVPELYAAVLGTLKARSVRTSVQRVRA